MNTQDIVIQRIESEVEWREEKQRELDREIQLLRDTRNLLLVSPSPVLGNGVTDIAQDRKADTVTGQITDGIYQVLLGTRPLHRKVIAQELQAIGVHLSGKDERERVQYLASLLSRDSRFKSMGKEEPRLRGEWTLVDAPADPPAAQLPATKQHDEMHEQPELQRVDSDMSFGDYAAETGGGQCNDGCQ